MALDLAPCHALWIGDRLGPVAAACLASFVRHGHAVTLHAYGPIADVPPGVTAADARAVLPESAIVRHRRSGSPALFSNRFRYRLMTMGAGYWIDCDLYCVRPLDFEAPEVFGLENDVSINTAVLRLPPDDPILGALERIFTDPTPLPPWTEVSRLGFQWLRLRRALGYGVDIGGLPWGVAGPGAVTHLLREAGRLDRAQPIDVFYPLDYDIADRIYGRDFDVATVITPRTRTIHLWNHGLRRHAARVPEPGSFLDRLVAGTLPF